MINKELLEKFPAERLDPFDGMSVTEEAWREAHEYHRAFQRFQTLLYHDHGIISGLKVKAHDPEDSRVVIEPGVAVDSDGRIIVIDDEITFNIRNEMNGLLHLLLYHEEGKTRPKADEENSPTSDLLYIPEEPNFKIQQNHLLKPIELNEGTAKSREMAVYYLFESNDKEELIKSKDGKPKPYIELARIHREKPDSEISNAKKFSSPGLNQIDMTHRHYAPQALKIKDSTQSPRNNNASSYTRQQTQSNRENQSLNAEIQQLTTSLKELEEKVAALKNEHQAAITSDSQRVVIGGKEAASEIITIGISYLGQTPTNHYHRHERGIELLCRHLSRTMPSRQLKLKKQIDLNDGYLKNCTLLFVVGLPNFKLNPTEEDTLFNYLDNGGTIFFESCRHQNRHSSSDQLFMGLMKRLGFKDFRPLPSPHPLLEEPYLFAKPPIGFTKNREAIVELDKNVIFSKVDYGCLWGGKQSGGAASREDIRAAMEWGSNIVEYAVEQRKRHRS